MEIPKTCPEEEISLLREMLRERDSEINGLLRQRDTLLMLLNASLPKQIVVLSPGMVSVIPTD